MHSFFGERILFSRTNFTRNKWVYYGNLQPNLLFTPILDLEVILRIHVDLTTFRPTILQYGLLKNILSLS